MSRISRRHVLMIVKYGPQINNIIAALKTITTCIKNEGLSHYSCTCAKYMMEKKCKIDNQVRYVHELAHDVE